VQLIANLSHFVLLCVNLLNRDANQRHIVCSLKGHPSRPKTLFKNFEIYSNPNTQLFQQNYQADQPSLNDLVASLMLKKLNL
jgi:hypothetical protein